MTAIGSAASLGGSITSVVDATMAMADDKWIIQSGETHKTVVKDCEFLERLMMLYLGSLDDSQEDNTPRMFKMTL